MTPRWRVEPAWDGQRWWVTAPECDANLGPNHDRCGIFTDRVAALDYAHARAAEDVAGQANPSSTVDLRAAIAEIARMRPIDALTMPEPREAP